jgi:hypothetical protein
VALNAVEYESIALKDLSTWSYYFYLDGGFPSATLRFYPVMPAGYQALLYPWHALVAFVTLDDPVSFPPGYELALQTNLSLHLVSQYKDCQINPLLGQQAQESLHWLKMGNQRPRHLSLPGPLVGPRSRRGTDRAAFISGFI